MTAVTRTEAAPAAVPSRRGLALLGACVAGLVLAGLVAVGGAPTGAHSVGGVVPDGARVAARASVDGAVVMVVAEGTERYVVVAHRRPKGWFGLEPPRPQPGAPVAWTATAGGGGVPSLSAVYGRVPGADRVEVTWADGRRQGARVGLDGTWLAARAGRLPVRAVRIIGPDGETLGQVGS